MKKVRRTQRQQRRFVTKRHKGRCPQCRVELEASAEGFVEHYKEHHQSPPTAAEFHQFRSGARRDTSTNSYPIGPDHHPCEVSGGLPSLGRKR